MTRTIQASSVPQTGPLSLDAVYRRADLHSRFGGNRYSGIVRAKTEPAVLVFHTGEPAQQFYRDGFDEDGVYWYSGEGVTGDMQWTAANRAIRDHFDLGLDLFFFERAQRKDGLWRFAHLFYYLRHKLEDRPDKAGKRRSAIIFGLIAIPPTGAADAQDVSDNLKNLRLAAIAAGSTDGLSVRAAINNVYVRAQSVRRYALARAAGFCEACGMPAPFNTSAGSPFLEVHHIDRLADEGPDRIDRVAAVCPNCHRRCHFGSDRSEYNSSLRSRIGSLEDQLQ